MIKFIRKTWLVAATIPLVTSVILLVTSIHFLPNALATISCPYCSNIGAGEIYYVPDTFSCFDCIGGLYFEFNCHSCCKESFGADAGFRSAVPEDQCNETAIWGSTDNGGRLACKWLCSGYPAVAGTYNGCPWDYIHSPNCDRVGEEPLGHQAGQVCEEALFDTCSNS